MTERTSFIVETPVVPVSDRRSTFSPTGITLGAAVAGRLAVLYAALFTTGMLASELVRLLQGHASISFGTALMMGVLALVVGGVPALLIGALGGKVIGWVLQYRNGQLSFTGAFTVGVGVGILILLGPNIVVARMLLSSFRSPYVMDLPAVAIVWYLPCLFALLGLGWVAHRLNLLIADSSPGPYP